MSSFGPWSVIIRTALVFLVCAYFTRAPLQRIGASIAGGMVFMVGNILWDMFAGYHGWWVYPGMGGRGYGPLVWYAGAGLGAAGISLLGWRVHRRFEMLGLGLFVVVFALFGLLRDWVVSKTSARHLLIFGSGVTPWVADYAGWFTLMASALAMQLAIARELSR